MVGEAPRAHRRSRRLPASGSGSAADLGRRGRLAAVGAPCRGARAAAAEAGHDELPLSINSHGYVADTSQQAGDEFFPSYAAMMNRIGKERGWAGITRQDFNALRTKRGALVVGSVDEVVEKILFQHELFGHQRFLAQMSVGSLPHAQVLRSIELLGTEVAPAVRTEVARRAV